MPSVAPMVCMGMPDMMVTMGLGGATVPAVVPPAGGGGGMIVHEKGYDPRGPKTVCIEVKDDNGKPITICKEVPPQEIERSQVPAVKIDETNYSLQDEIISELQGQIRDMQMQIDQMRLAAKPKEPMLPPPIPYRQPKYIIVPEKKVVEEKQTVVVQKVEQKPEEPVLPPILLPLDMFVHDMNMVMITIHEQNMRILEFIIKNPPIPPPPPLPVIGY